MPPKKKSSADAATNSMRPTRASSRAKPASKATAKRALDASDSEEDVPATKKARNDDVVQVPDEPKKMVFLRTPDSRNVHFIGILGHRLQF
jgi:hypothetical protein